MIPGEAVEPERQPGQFHRQGVEIDPVEAVARDEPAPVVGAARDPRRRPLDVGHLLQQRDDQARHLVGRVHQEVAAPHRGIADLEGEDLLLDEALDERHRRLSRAPPGSLIMPLSRLIQEFVESVTVAVLERLPQRPDDRLLVEEPDERLRRVVRAGLLALERRLAEEDLSLVNERVTRAPLIPRGEPDLEPLLRRPADPVGVGDLDRPLEDTLVEFTQVSNLEVFIRYGILLVSGVVRGLDKREEIERPCEKIIAQLVTAQEPFLFIIEQSAVVSHGAVFRVAFVHGVDQALQVFPEIVLARVPAVTPLEFTRLPAEGAHRVRTVLIGHRQVRREQFPGLRVEEEQASIDKLDGASEYLGFHLFALFLIVLFRVVDEPIADVAQHLIDLDEEGRLDFLFQHLFRAIPVIVEPAPAGAGGRITPLFLRMFLHLLRDERVPVEESLEESIFRLIIPFECFSQGQFDVVLEGARGAGGIKAPSSPVRQYSPP